MRGITEDIITGNFPKYQKKIELSEFLDVGTIYINQLLFAIPAANKYNTV